MLPLQVCFGMFSLRANIITMNKGSGKKKENFLNQHPLPPSVHLGFFVTFRRKSGFLKANNTKIPVFLTASLNAACSRDKQVWTLQVKNVCAQNIFQAEVTDQRFQDQNQKRV